MSEEALPLPSLSIGPLTTTGLVCAFVAFTGIALFNAAEILVSIFITFRRQTSCYFFSLLVAALGIIVYQTCVFLLIFATNLNIYGILSGIDIGWTAMVTGQSMVLWSRLHLVCLTRWKLNAVLCMIVVNGLVLHPVEIALTMRAVRGNMLDATNSAFVNIEKATLVIFFVQELLISSIYMMETWKLLRFGEIVRKQSSRRRMKQLLAANFFIICLDVTLVFLEFFSLWGIWCSFKGMAYSIKLKIEFWILSQLKESMTNPMHSSSHQSDSSYTRGKDASRDIHMNSLSRDENKSRSAKARSTIYSSIERGSKPGIVDHDRIMKTTEVSIQHANDRKNNGWESPTLGRQLSTSKHNRKESLSEASSEVEFAAHGV